MKPRISDVARHAGVSVATVSRVMNAKPVSSELVELVQAAVAELGYTPDRQARSLRRRRSDVVALIVPDIANPFYTAIARGVEDVALRAGLSLVLCNSDEDATKEARYLRVAHDERMAGIVIAAASPAAGVGPLLAAGQAVVAVDRELPGVDLVTLDNQGAGLLATRELLVRGFERPACITGPEGISTARGRADGWRRALRAAGLPTTDRLVHSDFRVSGGRSAAQLLLTGDEPPDSIVAMNNLLGVGVLQVAAELSLTELGVAVVGELPFATWQPPNLSVVPLRPQALGVRAAELLLERVEGAQGVPRRVGHAIGAAQTLLW